MKNKRLKGSSIIEVVIGIFIISLSMALTGVLFANVFVSSDRYVKQKATFSMNEWSTELMLNCNIEDEERVFESYMLEKKCISVIEEKDLWLIELSAININNKVMMSRRFLIEISDLDEMPLE